MKSHVAAGLVLAALSTAHPGVRDAAAGGVTSGGGVRTSGQTRLIDVLAPFAGGRTSGESIVFESGYANVITAATPIHLVSFSVAIVEGTPHLSWQLSDDSDPAGFHVYRSTESADGPFERLTPRPLAAAAREFVDPWDGHVPGSPAWYRLAGIARDGREEVLGLIAATFEVLPREVRLHPAFPNPARGHATFAIDLPAREDLELALYDLSGRQVAILFDGPMDAGRHQLNWDGTGNAGPLAQGIYFARLRTPRAIRTMKVVVTR